MQAQIARRTAQAGAGVDVKTQYSYTIGPDGQLYVTSARVTTSSRTDEVNRSPVIQEDTQKPLQPTATPAERPAASLADYAHPSSGLSPADEAAVFGSKEFLDEIRSSTENQLRSRLQVYDFGVRAQESQHFRAAYGLGSAPTYDYHVGPDGTLYAVAGEVGLKAGPAATPEDAAENATTMANAALAATDVSAQDISVARSALSQAASLYAANRDISKTETPRFQLAA